ncbi:MAG: RidA family protein [Bryobacteraceae bacterium]|jgi:2-iminobutanoate/2-iminopropanoate deaminase
MRKATFALTLFLALYPAVSRAEKKVIAPPEFAPAPGATANFSPAILVDGTLYISGQTGADLKTREFPSDFETEVKNTLDHIAIILKAANMTFDDVVSVQVYMTDVSLFQRMNAVYTSVIKEPRPARTTVGVAKLAGPNAKIEITMTARKARK